MLFNSIEYIVFLVLLIILFKLFKNHFKVILLFSSIVFYGYYDYFNILLLGYVTIVGYLAAILIKKTVEPKRKLTYLITSIIITTACLLYYKYSSFFQDNVSFFWGNTNQEPGPILKIVLPIGISFYTLQTIGYLIDTYRNPSQVENNFVNYALFTSFFPQLIAGPIERAKNLIPQIRKVHLNKIELYPNINRIIWGLFKKIVIADNLAVIIKQMEPHLGNLGLGNILIGYIMYFQIYCDFSGYVDIAIGSAQIFGIRLTENFNLPYYASSFKDFWHRWHITLSKWFRDYIYIPLGGNQIAGLKYFISILIVFTTSGLWHGANWNFVIWGLLHGILYYVERMTRIHASENPLVSFIRRSKKIKMFLIFNIISLTWIVFFNNDLTVVYDVFSGIFLSLKDLNYSGFKIFFNLILEKTPIEKILLLFVALCTMLFFEGAEILKRSFLNKKRMLFWTNAIILDVLVVLILISLLSGETYQFIYFRF